MLNALNAGLGLLSTVLIAFFYGTGREAEIYFAAIGLHASLTSLTQTGQVAEVLLPSYHALRESRGSVSAFRAYLAMTNKFLAVLASLCLLGWLIAPVLTRLRVPGFDVADIELATVIFQWIVPLVVLQVATALLKTLANAERLFGTPELVGAIARVLSLAVLLVFAGRLGVWALVLALWCAGVGELLGITWLLARRGFVYRPTIRLPADTEDVRLFSKLFATLPYVGFTQLYVFALDAGLSQLSQGSFAVFKYATTIWSRTQGVFLQPVNVTFFTRFSEMAARGMAGSAAIVEETIGRALAISALVMTAVLAGGGPVLTALWSGERFPPERISALVWLLAGLYVLLPVSAAATIMRKVAVTLRKVREMYLALAAVQVFSAVVAWQIVSAMGLVGALIASALNVVGFCLAPLLVLRFSGAEISLRLPVARLWRWTVAVVGGVTVALLTARLLRDVGNGSDWHRFVEMSLGLAMAALGCGTAMVMSWALRVPETRQLVKKLSHLLGRRPT
jgi:peptidoglycan biosynthesis protein MviN/MurJ (putative lipid II flippase)